MFVNGKKHSFNTHYTLSGCPCVGRVSIGSQNMYTVYIIHTHVHVLLYILAIVTVALLIQSYLYTAIQ